MQVALVGWEAPEREMVMQPLIGDLKGRGSVAQDTRFPPLVEWRLPASWWPDRLMGVRRGRESNPHVLEDRPIKNRMLVPHEQTPPHSDRTLIRPSGASKGGGVL